MQKIIIIDSNEFIISLIKEYFLILCYAFKLLVNSSELNIFIHEKKDFYNKILSFEYMSNYNFSSSIIKNEILNLIQQFSFPILTDKEKEDFLNNIKKVISKSNTTKTQKLRHNCMRRTSPAFKRRK